MSILPTMERHDGPDESARVGTPCFYCGKNFERGQWIVYWWGAGSRDTSIYLHQVCARNLGSHLIKDSFGRINGAPYQGDLYGAHKGPKDVSP